MLWSECPLFTGNVATVSCAAMYLDSWYELLLLAMTISSITLQLYTMVLIVSVSPTQMATYRYFLCLYTVSILLCYLHCL